MLDVKNDFLLDSADVPALKRFTNRKLKLVGKVPLDAPNNLYLFCCINADGSAREINADNNVLSKKVKIK